MRRRQTRKGFTIIELVVVILLLGILTATALPRFIDVTDDAHAAVVDAVEGGLATGMAMAHAQWFADNRPTSVTGFGPVNSNGWPTNQTGAELVDNTDCIAVVTDVLQGGRPTMEVETMAGATPVSGDLNLGTYVEPFAVMHSNSTCFFAYVAQGAAFSVPVISYDASTGEVSRLATDLN